VTRATLALRGQSVHVLGTAMLRRHDADWSLTNQSSVLMLNLVIQVQHAGFVGALYGPRVTAEEVPFIQSKHFAYIGSDLQPGDTVSISWKTIRRGQRVDHQSADINITLDVNDYVVNAEEPAG